MEKTRIMVVDDHTLFRKGIVFLLNTHSDMEVVGEAADGREFLEKIAVTPADVVLIDIEMPVMNGIEATRAALEKQPGLRIIALSMYGEEEYYKKMIAAGAKGYIMKNSDIEEVSEAIRTVTAGGTHFPSGTLCSVIESRNETAAQMRNLPKLSERESEILVLICQGFSNEEIGEKLFISKRTVEKHRANLLAKTSCKNTANLVLYAIENKLI